MDELKLHEQQVSRYTGEVIFGKYDNPEYMHNLPIRDMIKAASTILTTIKIDFSLAEGETVFDYFVSFERSADLIWRGSYEYHSLVRNNADTIGNISIDEESTHLKITANWVEEGFNWKVSVIGTMISEKTTEPEAD